MEYSDGTHQGKATVRRFIFEKAATCENVDVNDPAFEEKSSLILILMPRRLSTEDTPAENTVFDVKKKEHKPSEKGVIRDGKSLIVQSGTRVKQVYSHLAFDITESKEEGMVEVFFREKHWMESRHLYV